MKKSAQAESFELAGFGLMLRLALVASLALLATACTPKQAPVSERFLYVVDCEARVDKLDTVDGKKLATIALAERSPLVPKVQSAQSGLDGCIAESVLPDATGKQVSVIVPTTTRVNSEGKRDFQWLTFALPEWTFVSAKPAGTALEQPPFLQRDASGALVVKRAEERSLPTELDLREYKNATTVLANTIIESSGDVSLLRVFTAVKSRLVLGLANQRTRALTLLVDVPTTTVTNVHLAPGGDYVLVEVTEPTDGKSAPIRRTGALRLYDSQGKSVADVMDEGSRNAAFLALTPNGSAVYRSGGDYRFVTLAPKGMRFGNSSVTQPSQDAKLGLVFSGQ